MDITIENLLKHPFVTLKFRAKLEKIYSEQQPVINIDLMNLPLNAFEATVVSKILSLESNLEVIRLNFSKWVETENFIKIMYSIKEKTQIRSISVHNMFLNSDEASSLLETIASLKKLTNIHLSCNELTPDITQKLLNTLNQKSSLEGLSIIVEHIVDHYFNQLFTLAKVKKLGECVFGALKLNELSCNALTNLIKDNLSMRALDLCVNEIENIEVIKEALYLNTSLQRVTITTFIGDQYPDLQSTLDKVCKRNIEIADRLLAIRYQLDELKTVYPGIYPDYTSAIKALNAVIQNENTLKVEVEPQSATPSSSKHEDSPAFHSPRAY